MQISRTFLCLIYALIALFSLYVTWANIMDLMAQYGMMEGTMKFWEILLHNGPSRFIANDILFFTLAVMLFMLLEARRLQIPFVWAYILFGIFAGISVAAPFFLIHREIALAGLNPGKAAGQLKLVDLAGLALFALVFVLFALKTLTY